MPYKFPTEVTITGDNSIFTVSGKTLSRKIYVAEDTSDPIRQYSSSARRNDRDEIAAIEASHGASSSSFPPSFSSSLTTRRVVSKRSGRVLARARLAATIRDRCEIGDRVRFAMPPTRYQIVLASSCDLRTHVRARACAH